MKFTFNQTKDLIDFVLTRTPAEAALSLHRHLTAKGLKESQFYDGIIEHGPHMDYSSEQWFDFHNKIPHWRLRDEAVLMNKLSPNQRQRLAIR